MTNPFDLNVLTTYETNFGMYANTYTNMTPQEKLAVKLEVGNYYQYVGLNGFAYGDAAYEVSQNQGYFGQFANAYFSNAIKYHDSTATDAEIADLAGIYMLRLAAADVGLRNQESGDGSVSNAQIRNYHYAGLDTMELPRYVWGGAGPAEFIGTDSWMQLYEDYSTGTLTPAAALAFFGSLLYAAQNNLLNFRRSGEGVWLSRGTRL